MATPSPNKKLSNAFHDHNYTTRRECDAANNSTTICSMVHKFYKVRKFGKRDPQSPPNVTAKYTPNQVRPTITTCKAVGLNQAQICNTKTGMTAPSESWVKRNKYEQQEQQSSSHGTEQHLASDTHLECQDVKMFYDTPNDFYCSEGEDGEDAIPLIPSQPLRKVNTYLTDRVSKGRFSRDFADMVAHENVFKDNFHMTPRDFYELLSIIEDDLKPKRKKNFNQAIRPEEKLAAVIELFASGSLLRHIACLYRFGSSTFGCIVDEVCTAIENHLRPLVMPELAESAFLDVASGFHAKYSFPNVLGAIDTKLVRIRSPTNTGFLFSEDKDSLNLSVLAAADANFRFIYFDIGPYANQSDAKLFADSKLGQRLSSRKLKVPSPRTILDSQVPYFFIGDEAFPLSKHFMTPVSGLSNDELTDRQLVYNYRLLRARTVIEIALGILFSKWNILNTMNCSISRAQKIIAACCLLHNFLRVRNDTRENAVNEGSWGSLPASSPSASFLDNDDEEIGEQVRNILIEFVNAEGALLCQKNPTFVDRLRGKQGSSNGEKVDGAGERE